MSGIPAPWRRRTSHMLDAQDRQTAQLDQDVFPVDFVDRGCVAHREVTTGPSHAGCMDTNRASRRCEGTHNDRGLPSDWTRPVGPSLLVTVRNRLPPRQSICPLTYVQEAPHDDSGAKSCVDRTCLRRRVCFSTLRPTAHRFSGRDRRSVFKSPECRQDLGFPRRVHSHCMVCGVLQRRRLRKSCRPPTPMLCPGWPYSIRKISHPKRFETACLRRWGTRGALRRRLE